MLSDAPPLRVGLEELVDSVIVDVTIYNPGGPHLGAFPGPLLGAFRHCRISKKNPPVIIYEENVLMVITPQSNMMSTTFDNNP